MCDFSIVPSNSTHRDASNGGIDISGKCNFDHFLTKHRFRLLDFLIENYIFIEKLLFSLDTERMDIIFESVASKRFGWTKYQPIRMLYRDFSSKSVFSQGWSGSKSKQARGGRVQVNLSVLESGSLCAVLGSPQTRGRRI